MQNLHDENKNRIRENSFTMTKVPPQLILYLFGHAQYACQKNQFTREYERKKLEKLPLMRWYFMIFQRRPDLYQPEKGFEKMVLSKVMCTEISKWYVSYRLIISEKTYLQI